VFNFDINVTFLSFSVTATLSLIDRVYIRYKIELERYIGPAFKQTAYP